MVTLVEELFSSFNTVIVALAGGLKTAFVNLIYLNPNADNLVISPIARFVFVMAGVGLATGILYKIFGLIRARKG